MDKSNHSAHNTEQLPPQKQTNKPKEEYRERERECESERVRESERAREREADGWGNGDGTEERRKSGARKPTHSSMQP